MQVLKQQQTMMMLLTCQGMMISVVSSLALSTRNSENESTHYLRMDGMDATLHTKQSYNELTNFFFKYDYLLD